MGKATRIKGQLKAEQEPLAQEVELEHNPSEPAGLKTERGSIIPFPAKKYLDPSINIKTLPLPLARFPGVKRVIPEWELRGCCR